MRAWKPAWKWTLPRVTLVVMGLWWLASILLLLSVLTCSVPGFEQVRASTKGSEAELLDRHGEVISRLRLDHQRRLLNWVPLNQVSAAMQRAILMAEDKRFYQHPGLDPLATLSALVDNLQRSRARGASTISMQLAKLLQQDAQAQRQHDQPQARQPQHPWLLKLEQARLALALEWYWSKAQILEAYLNRVGFRGELVGIDAAARGLLAKGPDGLGELDGAILAALVRAPGASRSQIARRACNTLQAMQAQANTKQISAQPTHSVSLGVNSTACEAVEMRASILPDRAYAMPGVEDAPHLARRLLQQPGQRLQVSLDASLQRFALQTLRTHLAALSKQNVEDGTVLVLDNASGEVLAYVGSSGDLSGAREVDGVMALRQPGSTLKPFLYAAAFDQGWLNASSVLDDSPLALTTPSGLYIPQNYDRHFLGAVSVRHALGSSLNVPAVRTLTLVGVERFLQLLRDAGLESLQQSAEHYGFGLALGSGETTLLQLSNAYRMLANNGEWRPVRFQVTADAATAAEPVPGKQVLSAGASFIISDILADSTARITTFGLSSPLSTQGWAAVKTGTSKAMRDNWAIGYSQRYTVGVWVGNFSGAPMWDVSGITGAAPIWRDVIEYLHRNQSSHAPVAPPGVTRQQLRYHPAIEASRQEWVMHQPDQPAAASVVIEVVGSSAARLIAPPDSAIIAPDPDIPQARQSVLLQSSGHEHSCMRLDGKPVATCGTQQVLVPLPLPGKHVLSLTDKQGQGLDQHHFEVRGLQGLAKKLESDYRQG
ncbi:penicillin-binding protein 1C [Methylobacillus glycogenes]|uniref:penicillin-binding protein 1C n=1 Tax=Methylobacillus glycogenes TaxID=406 RepID=UPI0004712229|nr:penicillin-binding protein 1C [Methylobacillus glycogenes]